MGEISISPSIISFMRYVKRKRYVRFEVFRTVTMKNVVFKDVKPSPYFTEDTLRLRYRDQPVNAM
jgi:hypothetical protein